MTSRTVNLSVRKMFVESPISLIVFGINERSMVLETSGEDGTMGFSD